MDREREESAIDDIRHSIKHKSPRPEFANTHIELVNKTIEYAEFIESNIPAGRDRTFALIKLTEAAFWANSAIALNPR